VRRDWVVWLISSARGLQHVARPWSVEHRQQLQASRHRSKHGHIALAVLDERVMAPRRLAGAMTSCTAVIIRRQPDTCRTRTRGRQGAMLPTILAGAPRRCGATCSRR
jgi:hypothetical protein